MAKTPGIGSLKSLSTQEIERELSKRNNKAQKLMKEYRRLQNRLGDLERKILAVGGSLTMGGAKRGPMIGSTRPQNSAGLVESLVKVLEGKTMSVKDAAVAVQRAGYRTNAVNFRVIVNQAFIKHKTKFKKISHGKYTSIK